MHKTLLIVLGLCFVSFSAFAEGGFGGRGGISWGYGEMENETQSIQTREMNTIEVTALAGYKIANILVGPFLDYRRVAQNTKPEEVGNQNLRGNGYLVGVGASYTYSLFSFMGAVSFLGQHTLSNVDMSGNEVTYQKPLGFHLGLGMILNQWFKPWQRADFVADFTFSSVKYSEDDLSGTTSDVSTNKRSHWNAGMGISMLF